MIIDTVDMAKMIKERHDMGSSFDKGQWTNHHGLDRCDCDALIEWVNDMEVSRIDTCWTCGHTPTRELRVYEKDALEKVSEIKARTSATGGGLLPQLEAETTTTNEKLLKRTRGLLRNEIEGFLEYRSDGYTKDELVEEMLTISLDYWHKLGNRGNNETI